MGLHKLLSDLPSFKEFIDYLKALIERKIYVIKKEDTFSIILNKEVMFKNQPFELMLS